MTEIKVTVEYILKTEEKMTELQLLEVISQEVDNYTSQPTVFAHTKTGTGISIEEATLIDSAIRVYEKPME